MAIRVNDGTKDWTVREVCAAFGVSEHAVKNWADRGLLRHYRLPCGQRNRRFPPRAVLDFAVANGLPVPAALDFLHNPGGETGRAA